jgi:peptide/nickel transport system ATP-binding protein
MDLKSSDASLEVEGLSVAYDGIRVVHDVSLRTLPGRTLGLVGESGCGKSTIAKVIVGLVAASSGSVTINGTSITRARGAGRRRISRLVQLVFQDPAAALNPRASVGELIDEPQIVHGYGDRAARRRRTTQLLDQVQLPSTVTEKYPSELSGGQKQRVAIARALAVEPDYLVLDEVTSALDVSVQRTVLDLLREIQSELGLGYVFISHDLPVVRLMSDAVGVMRDGQLIEMKQTVSLFERPEQEYTRELIATAPVLNRTTPDQEGTR